MRLVLVARGLVWYGLPIYDITARDIVEEVVPVPFDDVRRVAYTELFVRCAYILNPTHLYVTVPQFSVIADECRSKRVSGCATYN